MLARDLPYISLWHEDNIAIMQENVEGYYMTPNARFEGLKDTKLHESDEQ
jgi:peptide/nickel transport system substrate-binding protein